MGEQTNRIEKKILVAPHGVKLFGPTNIMTFLKT